MGATPVPWRVALGIAALWIGLFLVLAPRYGPTWDAAIGELPFGERILAYFESGDARYLDLAGEPELVPRARSPHPDFRIGFHWWQIHPAAGLVSALCCRVLWTGLGVLPPITAHHLAIALFVAAWIVATLRFLGARAGRGPALLAVLLVLASPRFFADAFDNPKDVPEACLYVLASFAAYRALHGGGLARWVVLGATTGFALAQKPNAFFLAPQLLLYVVLARVLARRVASARDGGERPAVSVPGALAAALAALVAFFLPWAPMWRDPLGGALVWLAEVARTGRSQGFGISWHGVQSVLTTTPLPLILLAPCGLFAGFVEARLRLFLLLGVLVPIGRTLLPGARDFDGVRHFLEFLPPLGALAALGAFEVARRLARSARGARWRAALASLALLPGALAVVRTHPNGICYFNPLVGGLAGARARGVSDACDYWGNSYWQGLAWLDEHAEERATVLAPLAPHLLRATAPVALRSDLSAEDLSRDPIYVMYVVRPGTHGPVVGALDRELRPVREIRVDDTPILRIQRVSGESRARFLALLGRQARGSRTLIGLLLAAEKDVGVAWDGVALCEEAEVPGDTAESAALSRLQARLVDVPADDLADAAWLLRESRSARGGFRKRMQSLLPAGS